MPTTQLLDQYHQLLTRSNSYKILPPEQQAELWNGFEGATDEQLNSAIKVMESDLLQTTKREAENAEKEVKAAEEAKKMKEEQKAKNKIELMENEKIEQVESAKAADALMAQLQKIKVEGEPKKKKLFGIF